MPSLRCTNLFWQTLEPHRHTPYYRNLRFKLLLLAQAKTRSAGPANGSDRAFANPVLKNIWHIRLRQEPEVTLFYARRGDETVLAMSGRPLRLRVQGEQLQGRAPHRRAGEPCR